MVVPVAALPTSTALNTNLTQARPKVIQIPFSLPAGFVQDKESLTCPNPLPLDKIEDDYLAYWNAETDAYKQANSDLLKPFVDTASQGGKFWQAMKDNIDQLKDNPYYLEIEVSHADTLEVQVDPHAADECRLGVVDGGMTTTSTYKLKANATVTPLPSPYPPLVQKRPPNQAYYLVLRNGHWVLNALGEQLP